MMEETIKKYRSEIMGIATIMILLGHSVFYGKGFVNYGFLNDFITLGYSGVDIFLFLSGFGLAFSIQNNNKRTFWKHRINRLLPTCLCIWFLYILIHIKSLSLMTFITPILEVYLGGYWYIGFLIIVYLFFPWINEFASKRNGFITFFLSLFFSFLCLMPFIYQGSAVSCNPLVCIVTRFPIFTLGMLFAIKKFDILNIPYLNLILFILGILILIPYYEKDDLGGNRFFTTYYCLLLLTPPVLYIYSFLLSFSNMGGAKSVLRWFGKLSLEIYLVQVTIMPLLMRKLNMMGIPPYFNVLCSTFITVFVSMIINSLCKKLKTLMIYDKGK